MFANASTNLSFTVKTPAFSIHYQAEYGKCADTNNINVFFQLS